MVWTDDFHVIIFWSADIRAPGVKRWRIKTQDRKERLANLREAKAKLKGLWSQRRRRIFWSLVGIKYKRFVIYCQIGKKCPNTIFLKKLKKRNSVQRNQNLAIKWKGVWCVCSKYNTWRRGWSPGSRGAHEKKNNNKYKIGVSISGYVLSYCSLPRKYIKVMEKLV
jgi:hypothetical protein